MKNTCLISERVISLIIVKWFCAFTSKIWRKLVLKLWISNIYIIFIINVHFKTFWFSQSKLELLYILRSIINDRYNKFYKSCQTQKSINTKRIIPDRKGNKKKWSAVPYQRYCLCLWIVNPQGCTKYWKHISVTCRFSSMKVFPLSRLPLSSYWVL